MHQRIVDVISQLRQDVGRHLSRSAIYETCAAVGHMWRECVLDPATTVQVFLLQILHGNTALTHLRLLTGLNVTAAAFCLARTRLPLEVFKRLLRQIIPTLRGIEPPQGLWRGHRTFTVDGSTFSMPDTPELQHHFGQPSHQLPGCGFPVAHILGLFDSATGFLLDVLSAPFRTHDMSRVVEVHPALRPGDVLVGDRGFCSFAHVALLALRGIHGVFRLHQKLKYLVPGSSPVPLPSAPGREISRRARRSLGRVVRQLGIADHIVEWRRPEQAPPWMTREQFVTLDDLLLIRILSYDVIRPGYRTRRVTLVTTLLDADLYPWQELAELYRRRWQVETNLKHIKITMKMDVVHCKTVEGVLKELMIFALAYNMVRVVMVEAARRQGVEPDRISFVDALRWLTSARVDEELPELIVNPDRPGRVEPRVRKRRQTRYPLMQEPRAVLRKRLFEPKVAA